MAHAFFPECLSNHFQERNTESMKLISVTYDVSGTKMVVVAGGIMKPGFYPRTNCRHF
jgi:hypothetical protein